MKQSVRKAPIEVDLKQYKTAARFQGMAKRPRENDEGRLLQGDVPRLGTIFKFKNGLLNGIIWSDDAHYECYVDGILHKENGPAVGCTMERRELEEYWNNGELVRVVYPSGEAPEEDYEEFVGLP